MSRSPEALAEILWNYHRYFVPTDQADVIIGLGSYDLRVADRCAEMFYAGVSSRIVFTGSLGNWTREKWDRPEAEVFAERALERGVPEEAIFRETEATNIGENISLTRRLLESQGTEVRKIVVVTKPNTIRRAFATASKVWPEIEWFTDCPQFQFTAQPMAEHPLEALINEMVGDIERIQKYPELGFQIPQKIPEEVRAACLRLIEAGFNKHSV